MVQPEQIGHETLQQQMWEVYATNNGLGTNDGSELLENAPGRVGYPPESYTPDSH